MPGLQALRTFELAQCLVEGRKGKVTRLASVPWAFAFWGGDFWLFLQRATDASTVVYRVNAQTGRLSTSIPDNGKRIVGVGVSTCAPLIVI